MQDKLHLTLSGGLNWRRHDLYLYLPVHMHMHMHMRQTEVHARLSRCALPPPGFCDNLFIWTVPSPATSQVSVSPFVQSWQYWKCSDPDVCRNKCRRRFQIGSTHPDRTYMHIGCTYNRFARAACLFSSCSEQFWWRTSFPCLFFL